MLVRSEAKEFMSLMRFEDELFGVAERGHGSSTERIARESIRTSLWERGWAIVARPSQC